MGSSVAGAGRARRALLVGALVLAASALRAQPLGLSPLPPPDALSGPAAAGMADGLARCVYSAAPEAAPAADLVTLAAWRESPERRLARGLTLSAPADSLDQCPEGVHLGPLEAARPAYTRYPLDLTLQYRVPPDFCPSYLPEHEPGKNNAQLCGDELMRSWQLEQGTRRVNPFQVAAVEVDELSDDAQARRHKLGWLAAYAWLHRGEAELGIGAADLLLSDSRYARREVLLSGLGPLVQGRLPGGLAALTAVSPGEGEVAIDLCVSDEFSYDSVATNEQMLLAAAGRGIGALAIAGRGQLGDARAAERLTSRLKAEGRLPEGFRVVVGQYAAARTGDVVGLFLKDRLLDGQTMAETVAEIHRQGGLAYLARPGTIGAAAALDRLPFDGYFIQPGNFELFRTLLLLDDPRFAGKPALYASTATVAFGAGLPYTNVKLNAAAPDPLRAGLAGGQGYAASTLYFPWMMALLTKPIAVYQKSLNRFFQVNDALAVQAGRLVRADNLLLRTSWDDEMRDLISVTRSYPCWRRLISGGSPLRRLPKLTYIEAEYGSWSIGYDRQRDEWRLTSRKRW